MDFEIKRENIQSSANQLILKRIVMALLLFLMMPMVLSLFASFFIFLLCSLTFLSILFFFDVPYLLEALCDGLLENLTIFMFEFR